MTTVQSTTAARDQRTTDHTRPLDITITALEAAQCGTCQAILHMLLAHLEISIPAWPKGGVR
jgi:hypothetical protein